MVSAIDSSVLGSTYKAGLLRPAAMDMLTRLEAEHGVPSIALGRLGPPNLAKHLFEAYLFRRAYLLLETVLRVREDHADAPAELSRTLFALLEEDPLGIPVRCRDGVPLLRGPVISAPAYRSFRSKVPLNPEKLEEYALTWVDLRPARMAWWLKRFEKMYESRFSRRMEGWATERVNRATYLSETIEIGNTVAWIFSNEEVGYRVM